jgi:hypothetical protein
MTFGEVTGSFAGTLVKPNGTDRHPRHIKKLLAHSITFTHSFC